MQHISSHPAHLPSAAVALGTVAELWRYPVKSMRGERLTSLDIRADGIAGDRRFAIESSAAPAGKPLLSGRERAAVLLYSARTDGAEIAVRTPEGTDYALDDPALLAFMETHFERLTGRKPHLRLLHAERPLTDCRPISLLSQEAVSRLSLESGGAASGAIVDTRRFRANVLLALASSFKEVEVTPDNVDSNPLQGGFPEDDLVGKRILLGSATLRITERDPRCRIVTLDPETAEPDPALMKLIDRLHGGRVGVYAVTASPGKVQRGDTVRLAR